MSRVVIAAPIFNKARWLPEAVESLLGQTFRDFTLVLIDDGSDDGSLDLARAYAASDERVRVQVNPRRLGMLGNTNKSFEVCQDHPDAEFFALASDHDRWEPEWLETLVALLDGDPRAVMAYPLTRRIDDEGAEYPRQKPPWRLDTTDLLDARPRVRAAFRRMAAGDMIYGLIRTDALRRVRGYRPVLVPDRVLLSELALLGTFAQAPEILWRRRFRGLADLERQRQAFWPDGVPVYAHWPWWLQHAGALGWDYAVCGRGAPLGLSRAAGAGFAIDYLAMSLRHRAWRRRRRMVHRAVKTRNAALAPLVRAVMRPPIVRRVVRGTVVPALTATERTLARITEEAPR